MKIYVVSDGKYSDKYVYGVTADKEIADAMCRLLYEPSLEEFDLVEDRSLIEKAKDFMPIWRVIFEENGDIITLEKTNRWGHRQSAKVVSLTGGNKIDCDVYAKEDEDIEVVKKIACDARAKFLSEKFGIS